MITFTDQQRSPYYGATKLSQLPIEVEKQNIREIWVPWFRLLPSEIRSDLATAAILLGRGSHDAPVLVDHKGAEISLPLQPGRIVPALRILLRGSGGYFDEMWTKGCFSGLEGLDDFRQAMDAIQEAAKDRFSSRDLTCWRITKTWTRMSPENQSAILDAVVGMMGKQIGGAR